MRTIIDARHDGRQAGAERLPPLGEPAVAFLRALAAWQVAHALRRDRRTTALDGFASEPPSGATGTIDGSNR